MSRPRRRRQTADLVVIVLLFAGLAAFFVFTTQRRSGESPYGPGTTYSTEEDGAAALYLWFEDLGYRVRRIEQEPFTIPDEAALVFCLTPPRPYKGIEALDLATWAGEPGHTLVVATDGWQGTGLVRQLGVHPALGSGMPPSGIMTPTVPLWTSPPPGPVEVDPWAELRPTRPDYVAHLVSGDRPVLISFREERGRVIVAGSREPFTNHGLRDPGGARLVYNLLAGLPRDALILFDELHHRPAGAEAPSLRRWLVRSPWGWALLYAAALSMGWLVLRGRRFGRPVPAPDGTARRPQGEYVVSMAGLFRRAGRRAFVLRHQHDRLKRELARPLRLNPDLADADFVRELERVRDDLTADQARALGELLARLQAGQASESELVRLAGQVADWTRGKHDH